MDRRNVPKKSGQRDNLESSSDNSTVFAIEDGKYEQLMFAVETNIQTEEEKKQ